MTLDEALDITFDFFPSQILARAKAEGLYDLILSGGVKTGAEIYDHLSPEQASWQDADYSVLAADLGQYLRPGSVLQPGCGRGDLLLRLANNGHLPAYGIDRSPVMIRAAEERLKGFERACLYTAKLEEFDFSILKGIDNVVINNFWGLLDEVSSLELLFKLKSVLSSKHSLVIGPYAGETRIEKLLAGKVLKEKLGFVFTFSFFKDFAQAGYESELINCGGMSYFLLWLKN